VVVVSDGLNSQHDVQPARAVLREIVGTIAGRSPDARVGLMTGPDEGTPAPALIGVTPSRADLDRALDRFAPPSFTTPLLEKIVVASRALATEASPRRAVIVVAHNATIGSLSLERTAEALRAAGAQLWVLDLWPPPQRYVNDEETALREIPPLSGGRRVTWRGMDPAPGARALLDAL
jgi:hypothetical protein